MLDDNDNDFISLIIETRASIRIFHKRFSNFVNQTNVLSSCSCYQGIYYPIIRSAGRAIYQCDLPIADSFRARARASVRILVYSNHKTLGIKVVSRNSRYSDNRHETTMGKNGVKTVCTIINHAVPNINPINAPKNTWVFEWYARYTLL